MEKLIKIYGERNTNTNYLEKLINLNLRVSQLPGVVPSYVMRLQRIFPGHEKVRDVFFLLAYRRNLGWKHARVKPPHVIKRHPVVKNHSVLFITITKNPYSWILSLYRRPYHLRKHGPDLETFLASPCRTTGRDNTRRSLGSPVELWNIKNASYLQLPPENTLNITTESLFEDPSAVIDRIGRRLDTPRISNRFINYERSTKKTSATGSHYRDYYLNERWRGDLSTKAIAIINNKIDKTLMARFGYRLL